MFVCTIQSKMYFITFSEAIFPINSKNKICGGDPMMKNRYNFSLQSDKLSVITYADTLGCWGSQPVLSEPQHRSLNPENYLFVWSNITFSGSKYPKIYVVYFWKQKHWSQVVPQCINNVCINGMVAGGIFPPSFPPPSSFSLILCILVIRWWKINTTSVFSLIS